MGRQLFGDGPFIDAPVGLATALSSTSIEALWTAATWTPIYANTAKANHANLVHGCIRIIRTRYIRINSRISIIFVRFL